MIFETHAHYDDEAFDGDRDELLKKMHDHGIGKIINVGASLKGVRDTAALTEKYSFVYGAVGIHPEHVGDMREEDLEWLRGLLAGARVVAVGEIGLDYHWDDVPRDVQKRVFEMQLDAACSYNVPVVIHSRDCDGDMFPILKSWYRRLPKGLVMHCFSSSAELAREYVKMGFYVSFAGPVTFRNAKRGDAVRAVPDELLLAETDSPYLTPVPHRGEKNYPAYVRYVIEKLAEERGCDFETIERITSANARRLFGIS